MLGYQEKELKKVTLNTISEPDNETERDGNINEGLNKVTSIVKFIRKNGSKFTAKTTMTSISENEVKSDYQVAIIEDISKELEAERKLKASESRLSALISNLQTGVLLEDEDGKIALTNQKFCNIFNIKDKPAELIGKIAILMKNLISINLENLINLYSALQIF
ncbi:PAS domain-containing protein [Winogradskyella maritima]|nr:PAS domain-containing protein [Winogradskyella maritima]